MVSVTQNNQAEIQQTREIVTQAFIEVKDQNRSNLGTPQNSEEESGGFLIGSPGISLEIESVWGREL